jgi:uncharacterized protein (TIGR02147 family)
MGKGLNIFEFENYREFLRNLFAEREEGKRNRKLILSAANMSSSLMTQILSDKKQLSMEAAYEITMVLNFGEKETDYFLALVEVERSGTVKLKARYERKLKVLRQESREIIAKVSRDFELSESEKAIYYSSWVYTGIRNFLAAKPGANAAEISRALGLSIELVNKAILFLIEVRLITDDGKRFHHRPGYTHLDSSEILVFRHHQNWRQKAVESMDRPRDEDLHYTCPMGISTSARSWLRDQLVQQIAKMNSHNMSGNAEVSTCLTIDLFDFTK